MNGHNNTNLNQNLQEIPPIKTVEISNPVMKQTVSKILNTDVKPWVYNENLFITNYLIKEKLLNI